MKSNFLLNAMLYIMATSNIDAHNRDSKGVFGIEYEQGAIKIFGNVQEGDSALLGKMLLVILGNAKVEQNAELMIGSQLFPGIFGVSQSNRNVNNSSKKDQLLVSAFDYALRTDGKTYMYDGTYPADIEGENLPEQGINKVSDETVVEIMRVGAQSRYIWPEYYDLNYEYDNNKQNRKFVNFRSARGGLCSTVQDYKKEEYENLKKLRTKALWSYRRASIELEFLRQLPTVEKVPKSTLSEFNDPRKYDAVLSAVTSSSESKVTISVRRYKINNLANSYEDKKIAILNFSNRHHVGAGVPTGETGQEGWLMLWKPDLYLSMLEYAKKEDKLNKKAQEIAQKFLGNVSGEILNGEGNEENALYGLYDILVTPIDENKYVISSAMPQFWFVIDKRDEEFLTSSKNDELADKIIKNSIISQKSEDEYFKELFILYQSDKRFVAIERQDEFITYYKNLHVKFFHEFMQIDELGIQIIIAGADGTGVYNNAPEIVILAIKNVINYMQKNGLFKHVKEVIFAVIPDYNEPHKLDFAERIADILNVSCE